MTDEELRLLQEYAARMGLTNFSPPPPPAPPPPAPPPMPAQPMLAADPGLNKVHQKQIVGTDPDQYWETLRLLSEDAKQAERKAALLQADKDKATRPRGAK